MSRARIMSMIDRVFHRLMVVDYTGKNERGDALYLTLCACGNHKHGVRGIDLRSGRVKSCGCLHRESAARISHLGGMAYAAKVRTSHLEPA